MELYTSDDEPSKKTKADLPPSLPIDPTQLTSEIDTVSTYSKYQPSQVPAGYLDDDIRSVHLEDNPLLLAERKDSKLQRHLDELRKLEVYTEIFKKIAEDSAMIDHYERNSNLGPPSQETDSVQIEETKDELDMSTTELSLPSFNKNENKGPTYFPELDPQFKIDNEEVSLQYVAGAVPMKPKRDQMDIKTDIKRLILLYLEANTKFKLSMPSENVENLLYEKTIYNFTQAPQPQMSDSMSIRGSTNKSLTQSSSQFGSVSGDKGFNSSSTSIFDSTTSLSARNSATTKNLKSEPEQIRKEEKKIEQCTPYIVRMDLPEDDAEKQVWQDFVSEIRMNSTVSADILELILEQGFNKETQTFDLQHRTMLVNLTQMFFDNLYQDDRLAQHENNLFLRIFLKFARKCIDQSQFGKDQIGQVMFKNEGLRQIIMCLFEGLSRKIPSSNYLRFIYAGPFNRVNMYQMDQDLRRHQTERKKEEDERREKEKKAKEGKDKKDTEKKPGFFAKIWSNFKDKDKKKAEEEKKPPADLKDGDMDFAPKEEENKDQLQPFAQIRKPVAPGQKLFQAMSSVYGGDPDPFGQIDNTKDPSQLKRFEEIEQRIQEERVNNHKLVYQDKRYKFAPSDKYRIRMTEEAVRNQFQHRTNQSVRESGKPRQTKDLTYYIKTLVQKNFEQMLNFSYKIPFAIRAMLRIILVRSRGINDFNFRLRLEAEEVNMMAQILIGGWLNTGYRNPKCFGIQPSVEKELELEFIFFQAARITFEHAMMMQKIPDNSYVEGFDLYQLNTFITELSSQVFVFWIRLINIDISEINQLPQESLIESSLIRVNDMELLYHYANQSYLQHKHDKDEAATKRQKFNEVMSRMDELNIEIQITEGDELSFVDQVIIGQDKLLIPPNRIFRSISEHFIRIISPATVPQPFEQFEYYLLFMRKKADKQPQLIQIQYNKETLEEIKIRNFQFVKDKLIANKSDTENSGGDVQSQLTPVNKHELGPQETLSDLDSPNNLPVDLKRAVSTAQNTDSNKLMQQRSQQRQSLQYETVNRFKKGEINQKTVLVRLNKITTDEIPLEKVSEMVLNIFSTLRMLLKNQKLIFEPLKDQSSQEETKDLVHLFLSAAAANRVSSNPDPYIQAGCLHIVRSLRKLNLEWQYDIQNRLIDHFCSLMRFKQERFKKIADINIQTLEQLGADVYRFEQNITNLKQFHKKFDNQLTFNKTISRYNPEVCFLECFKFDLNDEYRKYRGLLLNLSCSLHQTNLPMSSYMLFGVVRRSVCGVVNQPIQPQSMESLSVTEEDLEIRKVRDQRVSRFREHHYPYTTFTVSLQNSQEIQKPKDEQIKLIEAMIQYYSIKQKNYLKTLIKADNDKYKFILPLKLVTEGMQHAKTDQEKFDLISDQEPFDYMNMVATYTMFLEHISVMSSQNPKDDYINHRDKPIKKHQDFLKYDLQAKTLRYSIHDYVMRRLHKAIFGSAKQFEKDVLVQQLILAKANHPDWVLTSKESEAKLRRGEDPKDFTKMREWTNTHIYSSSLKTLLKINDEETPHMKALYIDDAQRCAMLSLSIAAPYKKQSDVDGAETYNRVVKHLMIETCKIYAKANTNPRLYSQLLYILLFNVPKNEEVWWDLVTQDSDFTLQPQFEQHNQYLGRLQSRNVAYEMFMVVKLLLIEHRQSQPTTPSK